ncbi:MAG: DegT/DnrJ/EryC1/StrS family aminotransferase, partial [Hyphomonas sp.]|nr:DegT/DnrJ/EryC1/StrS family aminotransferase [Hyphomonas sp.]
LQAHLGTQGIPTAVYYPVPIHMQDFAAEWAPPAGTLPVTEAASRYVIALPMHPYLGEDDQDRIIEAVCAFNG